MPHGSSMPAALAKMPKAIQQMVKQQCGGDWSRVTVVNGAVTVHNTPQRKAAPKKAAVPRAPIVPPARVTSPPAPAAPPAAPTPVLAPPPPVVPEVRLPVAPVPEPVGEPSAADDAEQEPPDEPQGKSGRVHPAQRLRTSRRPPWDRSAFSRATPVPRWQAQPKPAAIDPSGMRRVELPPAIPRKVLAPKRTAPAPVPAPKIRQVPQTPVPPPAPEAAPGPPPPAVVRTTPVPEVVLPHEVGRQIVHDDSGRKWILLPGVESSGDWATNLEHGTMAVYQATLKGVPPEAHLFFHDDVTALHGIDLDMVEAACRKPQRVEIAPETAAKKYPVIKYFRGDVLVVVGYRELQLPKIIAAYVAGRNLADNRPATINGGTGGGSRRTSGLPKSPKQLLNRLLGLGAVLTEDATGKTHSVKFWDEELGQVATAPGTDKASVENSYQRMARKIEAVKMRKSRQDA